MGLRAWRARVRRAVPRVMVGAWHPDVQRAPAPRHPSSCSPPLCRRACPSRGDARPVASRRRRAVGDRPTPRRTPSPTPTATTAAIPTDCREILSDGRARRSSAAPRSTTPPSDRRACRPTAASSASGRDPARRHDGLTHRRSRYMSRGPALDMLNGLPPRGLHLLHPRRRHPLREDVVQRAGPGHRRAHAVLAGRHPDRHDASRTSRRAATPPRSSRSLSD